MVKTLESKKNISPLTGWVYEDWQNIGHKMLQNMYSHFTNGRALVRFAGARPSFYGPLSDMVEGFARTFLLVGFWLKHRTDGKMSFEHGKEVDWAGMYREGMIHGTDPKHPEYWR